MITPSFGLTATERVLPRLALDFTTASLDNRVTFTRSGNTATVVNSSGYVESINADLPRFDYDPISLVCKGLLIEEARTNALPRSEEFNASPWAVSGTAAITADQETAPSNALTADLFRCGATAASEVRQVSLSIAAGSHTFSVFAKKEASNFIVIQIFDVITTSFQRRWFNLNTGAVGSTASLGANIALVSSNITPAANGFYRCSISVSLTSSTITGRVSIFVSDANGSFNGTASSGLYIWGAQLEAGAFPTSYIPTEASAVTRNADVATMTGTNFSDWFNQDEGSFMVQYNMISRAKIDAYPIRVAGGSQPIVSGYVDVVPNIRPITGNTNGGTVNVPAGTTLIKAANRYSFLTNTKRGAVNGTLDTTQTGLTARTSDNTTAVIGSFGGGSPGNVNSWMQKISYWPYALTDAQVQAFSKN